MQPKIRAYIWQKFRWQTSASNRHLAYRQNKSCITFGLYNFYFYMISKSSNVCPPSRALMLSPALTAPTPTGVPVYIRSPMRKVMYFETWAIISSTLKSISRVKPRCRSSPLSSISNVRFCTSPPSSDRGIN